MLAVAFFYVLIVTVFGWLIAKFEKFIDITQKNPPLLREYELPIPTINPTLNTFKRG